MKKDEIFPSPPVLTNKMLHLSIMDHENLSPVSLKYKKHLLPSNHGGSDRNRCFI